MNDETKVRQLGSEPDPPVAAAVEPSAEEPTSAVPSLMEPSPVEPSAEEPTSAVPSTSGRTAANARYSVSTTLLLVLLLVVVGGSVVAVRSKVLRIQDLNRQIEAVNAQISGSERVEKETRETQEQSFVAEDFPARFAAVKTADQAVSDAFGRYSRGDTLFGSVNDALRACYVAVDGYNKAAAPYPATLFTSAAPARIDLQASSTDCGRPLMANA